MAKDTLPSTVAILVTPKYVDRVTDALLGKSEEWLSAKAEASETRKRRLEEASYRVVSTPDTEKMSQVYVLLLIENTTTTLKALHPMARQNMSWGIEVTHDFKGDDLDNLVPQIYKQLLRSGFDPKKDVLRAHTFPKDLNETICRSLQEAAGGACEDPYEGPISMTASRSKCTHVVAVIRHETGYLWEVQDQATHFAAKFNHNANDEVLLEPTDSSTGENLSSGSVAATVPVSRAYYKLRQVWDEILSLELPSLSRKSIAVDLGASPGGWTQVLKHAGYETVVSVDPAALANRVETMPGVVHVASDMTSDNTVNTIKEAGLPISLLVCDACVFSGEILEKTIELVERLDHDSWALPAALVITLKMPYKQTANLNRNIEKATKKIPAMLNKAACAMYKSEVKVRYKVVHLMANSPLERTLIAIFEAT